MYDCHKEGVTVDREFDSPKGDVKGIRMNRHNQNEARS